MWPNTVTLFVCAIISHYTTPPCIAANILSQEQTTHTKLTVVIQIPSINYIQECHSVLLCITKNLDVFEPAKIPTWKKYSLTAQAVGKFQYKMSSLVYHKKMGKGSSQSFCRAIFLKDMRHQNPNVNQ